jgi:hypothetical protein
MSILGHCRGFLSGGSSLSHPTLGVGTVPVDNLNYILKGIYVEPSLFFCRLIASISYTLVSQCILYLLHRGKKRRKET